MKKKSIKREKSQPNPEVNCDEKERMTKSEKITGKATLSQATMGREKKRTLKREGGEQESTESGTRSPGSARKKYESQGDWAEIRANSTAGQSERKEVINCAGEEARQKKTRRTERTKIPSSPESS